MRSLPVLMALGIALTTHLAFADDPTKQQCIDADTQAQSLRADGKLAASIEQLRICSSTACPQIVRDDCTRRLDQTLQQQPTIDFSVRDASGQDLAAVAIDVDGKRLTDKLTGNPMPVDTGDHAFTFTAEGHSAVTKHFLIHAGEKNRRESITLGAAQPATPTSPAKAGAAPTEEPAPSTQESNPGGTQRVIGIAVAGVGVVGVAVGAIFGVSASSSWSSSKNECGNASSCPNHSQAVTDHDSAVSSGTISTVAIIAGGVFIAGGAVLYFTAPKKASGPTVGLSPTLGGAVLRGTF